MPQCPLSAWACLPCAPGWCAFLDHSSVVLSFCMFDCTILGLGFLHSDVLITHRKETMMSLRGKGFTGAINHESVYRFAKQ